jgi:hypothetical protein
MLEKFDKQRALAVEEERHHHFTGTCVYGFGFLRWGSIHVFPLLALQLALGFKMVAPSFVPSGNTGQKSISSDCPLYMQRFLLKIMNFWTEEMRSFL